MKKLPLSLLLTLIFVSPCVAGGFSGSGSASSTDTLDDVCERGASTDQVATFGGVTITRTGTDRGEMELPEGADEETKEKVTIVGPDSMASDYDVELPGVAGAVGEALEIISVDNSVITSKWVRNQKAMRFNLPDPDGLYAIDHEWCIIPSTPAAMTITSLTVTCDANPTTEFTGDLMYADAFIGLANSAVINDFDTADGVRTDISITNGSVPAGKCVYIAMDDPDDALNQVSFAVEYNY